MAKKKTIEEVVRAEMDRQGATAYGVAEATGIATSTILRFRGGGGMRSEKLGLVVDHLDMHLIPGDQLRDLKRKARQGHG